MRDNKKIEEGKLLEFSGKMTGKIILAKRKLLYGKRASIDAEIAKLDRAYAEGRYGHMDISEVQAEWDEKSPDERWRMAKDIPEFKECIRTLNEQMRQSEDETRDKLFTTGFCEGNKYYGQPKYMFVKYCKNNHRR